jgi:predicted Na+-dependent transporter
VQVTLGSSLALSLPIHSVVCLLVVGCCPTGVLSPVFCVLQQSHVELAIMLTLIETAAAFGEFFILSH